MNDFTAQQAYEKAREFEVANIPQTLTAQLEEVLATISELANQGKYVFRAGNASFHEQYSPNGQKIIWELTRRGFRWDSGSSDSTLQISWAMPQTPTN